MARSFSLRRRLTASMLLIFILGLGASATFFYLEARGDWEDLRERTLRAQARDLLAGLRTARDQEIKLAVPPDWIEVYKDRQSGFHFTLYDADRRSTAVSLNLRAPLPFTDVPDGQLFGPVRFAGVGAEQLALVSAQAPGKHVLVIGRRLDEPEVLAESLLEERYEPFLVFLPFALTSLVLLWFISDRVMRPLVGASRQASVIGPSDLSARIDDSGLPSEIRPLVDAMNGALSRLARALLSERRFTADAAHGLRTPLAVLSFRLQQAKRSGATDWKAIEEDLAQMTHLVGQLIDLARKERSTEARDAIFSPVNLCRVAREAAVSILPLVEEAGRRIEVDAAAAVYVPGRADDLRDMVCNLLENALVHGSGTIRVEVRKELSPGSAEAAVVEVVDAGEGVPETLKDAVFERFRKGRQSSPGAGIGLAIVRQVVRSHDGEVRFLPGPGCRVSVALPILDRPPGDSQAPSAGPPRTT